VQTRRRDGAEAPVEIRVNRRQVKEAADMPGSALSFAADERLATSVAALVVEKVTSGSYSVSCEESDGGHPVR
jgi:hypothetical protein